MTAASPNPSNDTGDNRCPVCPRCGYDQRGPMNTWAESCPLQGTCTECGLTFAWCEILRPEKFEPQWCIEFEPKMRRLPRAALRTYVRSYVPWLFWSRLKMSDAIRWRRLIAYMLLLLAPPLLIYVIGQGSLATYARVQIQGNLRQMAAARPATIQNLQASLQKISAWPLTGDAIHDGQIKAQIVNINAEIARLQALGTASETIDSSWLVTTTEAIIAPLSTQSSASIVDPAGRFAYSYIPPSHLLNLLWQRNSFAARTGFAELILSLAWLAWGIAMAALLPLSFALMPLSLRKSKVRWVHVVRVTIYSLFLPFTVVWLSVLIVLPSVSLSADDVLGGYASMVKYVPWLAMALWWHAATSRYLKIPHAWLAIGLLTLMSLLILLGVTAAINEQLAWEMLDLFRPLIG